MVKGITLVLFIPLTLHVTVLGAFYSKGFVVVTTDCECMTELDSSFICLIIPA